MIRSYLLYFYFAALMAILLVSCSEHIDAENPEDRILKFNSSEDFENTTNRIVKMSDDELDVWENERSFISYRTILLKAYREIEQIQTEDEQTAFLSRYKDILTVVDSTIVPHISIPLYQSIANRAGLYQTDGFVHKIFKAYIIATDVKYSDDLITMNFKSIIRDWEYNNNKPSFVEIFKISDVDERPKSIVKTQAGCTANEVASYFYNRRNCRNDREVVITAYSYVATSSSSNGVSRQPRVLIEVKALRRMATFCKWYVYDTNITRRNVSFSIMAWESVSGVSTPRRYDVVVPDSTTSVDTYYIKSDYPMGSAVLNQSIPVEPFISLYGEGTHRGVDGNWAVLNCN